MDEPKLENAERDPLDAIEQANTQLLDGLLTIARDLERRKPTASGWWGYIAAIPVFCALSFVVAAIIVDRIIAFSTIAGGALVIVLAALAGAGCVLLFVYARPYSYSSDRLVSHLRTGGVDEAFAQTFGKFYPRSIMTVFISASIGMTLLWFSACLAELYELGLASVVPRSSPGDTVFWDAVAYLTWHLLDSIPILEVPTSLNWELHRTFSDHWSGVTLVMFKIAVIVPLLHIGAKWYGIVRHGPSTRLK